MFQKFLQYIKTHPKKTMVGAFLILFLMANISAYFHAYNLTHYSTSGTRTQSPEDLTFFSKMATLTFGVTIPRPLSKITPEAVDLLFETYSPTSPNGTLEIWRIPKENPLGAVFLFHGYSGSKSGLINEAKLFHEMGFSTVLTDFYGSGGSSDNATTLGYKEADDIVAVVDYVQKMSNAPNIILYGQSMGSAAILRAVAEKSLRSDLLILENPFDSLLETTRNRFSSMGIPSFPGAELILFWGGIQQDFAGFDHNPAEYAKAISTQTLLLHGAKDPRVTIPQMENVFHNLKGKKQLFLFEQAGHESLLAADSEEWKNQVAGAILELFKKKDEKTNER